MNNLFNQYDWENVFKNFAGID